MAKLLSISTALPDHCVTAADTKAYISGFLPSEVAARVNRLYDASGNRTRYSVMPLGELRCLHTLEARSKAYARHAMTLSEIVTRNAFEFAGVSPESVGALICVSSTGYLMPSLETHLISHLKMGPACRRVPIMQLGCSGGVAGIGLAAELLGDSSRQALVVSVELPSLSLQVTEPSLTDIMSSVQFGDGAAAAVLSGGQGVGGLEVLATRSTLFPNSADRDGIRLTETGLRLMPQRGLPGLVRRWLPLAMREFLEPHGLRPEDISFWVVHPRVPQMLDAVRESLKLDEEALKPSRAIWERCGNTVSSSVFFILREIHESAPPPPGELGVMLAVGAGVTCEMVLLRSLGPLGC